MAEEWTIDTAMQHILKIVEQNDLRYAQRFDAQEKAMQMALAEASKAVNKAEGATEKRFEGVNEFRAQLTDQARTFMPRAEAEIQMKAMAEAIEVLRSRVEVSEGHGSGVKDFAGWIVGAIGVIIAIASYLAKH